MLSQKINTIVSLWGFLICHTHWHIIYPFTKFLVSFVLVLQKKKQGCGFDSGTTLQSFFSLLILLERLNLMMHENLTRKTTKIWHHTFESIRDIGSEFHKIRRERMEIITICMHHLIVIFDRLTMKTRKKVRFKSFRNNLC